MKELKDGFLQGGRMTEDAETTGINEIDDEIIDLNETDDIEDEEEEASWQTTLEEIARSEKQEILNIERRERERERKRALRRKKKRRIMYTMWFLMSMAAMLVMILVAAVLKKAVPAVTEYVEENVSEWKEEHQEENKPLKVWTSPDMMVDLLTPNEYSRPQEPLPEVKNIFVHYTANQGTSAAQNKSYFENLGITGERSASAHFVVGYNGEMIQCLPLTEIGYAVMQRNYDSVSIECCYLSEDGRFTQATKESLVELLAWLIGKYDLTTDDILRHYDSNGKLCPKYYVEHEDEWEQIKKDVDAYIVKYGTTEPPQEMEQDASE